MRKALGAALTAVVLVFGTGAAWAGHDYGGYDDECGRGGYCAGEDNRGDCRGSSEHCSDDDFSPRFDDSPVHVCLPGSTCNFDGRDGQQPPA